MSIRLVCLDWGDTVMKVFPYDGPMSEWPRVAAMEGVREALAELPRVALLTNAGDSSLAEVKEALARVGLDEFFEAVVMARDVGVSKADPAFYQRALALLGCRPEEAVMVGDSYENDVATAKKAGLKTVWFVPPGRAAEPPAADHDAILRDMRMLPEVVRRL